MCAPGMLEVVVTVASVHALVVPAIVVKFSSDPIVHKEDHACKCKCDTSGIASYSLLYIIFPTYVLYLLPVGYACNFLLHYHVQRR